MFGSSFTSPSLFSSQPAPAAASPFGTTAPQQPSPFGGSSPFGANTSPTLFGSAPAAGAAQSSPFGGAFGAASSVFGAAKPATAGFGAPGGGGLFGSGPAPATGGLFGASTGAHFVTTRTDGTGGRPAEPLQHWLLAWGSGRCRSGCIDRLLPGCCFAVHAWRGTVVYGTEASLLFCHVVSHYIIRERTKRLGRVQNGRVSALSS